MAEKESKPPKKGKPYERWKLYEVSGTTLKRKNKFCPKCSEGNLLANHSDRLTCGKCHYTEFISKENKEEVKA
tara:strand:- start:226 stop:444 length:219 start_codon:yes stop_codon:yes gene_type:complete